MANINKNKGVIGILTGGGDVPGLNPAIRAVTIRAIREGYKVIGIKRGWGGMVDIIRDKDADNRNNYIELSTDIVNTRPDAPGVRFFIPLVPIRAR
jgi:ATP-dependent phosphofructokinase / diphosphate-dependent phosphofructokinase